MERSPWSHWTLLSFFYQANITLNISIAVTFWLAELPYQGQQGEWDRFDNSYWVWLWFMHTVPQILIISEWFHNSIQIGAYQSTYITLLLGCYNLYLWWDSKQNNITVYSTKNWDDDPTTAAKFSAILIITYFVVSMFFICWTAGRNSSGDATQSQESEDEESYDWYFLSWIRRFNLKK